VNPRSTEFRLERVWFSVGRDLSSPYSSNFVLCDGTLAMASSAACNTSRPVDGEALARFTEYFADSSP